MMRTTTTGPGIDRGTRVDSALTVVNHTFTQDSGGTRYHGKL
jgi:hypothetical protein